MKFNIGCGWRNFGKGWIHIDGGDYDHLDSSDIYLKDGKLIQANSELERALRITKEEGAIYLRLAHLRLIQGLLTESKSFASRPET